MDDTKIVPSRLALPHQKHWLKYSLYNKYFMLEFCRSNKSRDFGDRKLYTIIFEKIMNFNQKHFHDQTPPLISHWNPSIFLCKNLFRSFTSAQVSEVKRYYNVQLTSILRILHCLETWKNRVKIWLILNILSECSILPWQFSAVITNLPSRTQSLIVGQK